MEKITNVQSTQEPTDGLIGFCGINCGECKAFVTTKNDDPVMRKLVAEEWSKSFGHQMKPEDINCVGCIVTEGPHIGHCAVCEIRNCGTKMKVENCAFCTQYSCSKLEQVHSRSTKAKETLQKIHEKTKKK